MAVYKVIQDIESEDRLLGPLTLKGLVYAGIVAFCVFIDFKLGLSGGSTPIKLAILLISLFPIALFGTLALPLGREQPTEVWLLARIRFLMQPRTRIWNQSGLLELVTITAPKKLEAMLTKNLSQTEVKSRLSALANTLDSRGWAVKNVNINMTGYSGYFQSHQATDRLIDTAEVLREVPVVDVHASDDILDAQSNPTAQKFQDLMTQAETQRRQALQEKLAAAKATPAEEPEIHAHAEVIHDLKPLSGLPRKPGTGRGTVAAQAHQPKAEPQVTEKVRADKLELAQSGNDLSVASIAKLAGRNDSLGSEVEIDLH